MSTLYPRTLWGKTLLELGFGKNTHEYINREISYPSGREGTCMGSYNPYPHTMYPFKSMTIGFFNNNLMYILIFITMCCCLSLNCDVVYAQVLFICVASAVVYKYLWCCLQCVVIDNVVLFINM